MKGGEYGFVLLLINLIRVHGTLLTERREDQRKSKDRREEENKGFPFVN